MKLKKNDLAELKKGTLKEVVAKIKEAKAKIIEIKINKHKEGVVKDVRMTRTLKRSIAQLSTIAANFKGATK